MNWFWVSIAAYLLLAFASLTDKFLLNRIKNSWSYTVFVCLAGGVVALAGPWALHWPGWLGLATDVAVATTFIAALFFLYEALSQGEASRILVFIGSTIPLFSLIFSLILGEKFQNTQLVGLALLIAGAFLIAAIKPEHNFFQRFLGRLNVQKGGRPIFYAVLSALAYSLYFLSSKSVYVSQGFLSGFVWIRIMVVAIIALTFVFPLLRHKVQEDVRRMKGSSGNNPYLMLFNQGVGAAGFILQNWAISLGTVAVVNALQGVQYGFLIISASLLSRLYPSVFPTSSSIVSWSKKAVAIVLISLGLYFIY